MFTLIKIRTLIYNNFVSIYAIVDNNKSKNNLIKVPIIYRRFLQFIPFFLIKSICNIYNKSIIYKVENIYNISNNNDILIIPVVLNIELYNDELNIKIDVTNIIKYYNPSIPFIFFIYNNNLIDYSHLKIKFFNKKIINTTCLIENIKYNNIYTIYKFLLNNI